MTPYGKLIILLLLRCSTALGLSPEIAIGDFGQRLWTSENGLPQNSILAITQTRDGYLWLGTQAGLARFDGAGFQVFNTRNSGLPHNDVFALAEDRDGNLWIGTFARGISRYKNGIFTNFGSKEGLTDEVVRCIYTDWRGVLWVGTRTSGVFAFQNGRFQQFSARQGLANDNVRSFSEDAQGNLWIGTENGLSRFRDGNFKTFTTKEGLAANSIRWISRDTLDRLWIATDSGLTVLQEGEFKNPVADGKLSNESVRFVTEDRHRNIWVATDAGLNRIYNGKVTSYANIQRLSQDPILSIYEDREANLWIGTDGGGLIQLNELKFRNFGGPDGLPDHTSYSVLEDRSGNLWIGTRSAGLFRWKDGQKRVYTTEDGLLSNTVFALYEDSAGDIWVGTRGGGINLIRNNAVTSTKLQQLSNLTVRVILQTRDGSYWIGTNNGLNRWKDGEIKTFTTQDGLSHGLIHSLFEDRNGTLWIGTFRGLSRWMDGKFSTISHSEKLKTASIWAIQKDTKGDLWIATYGSGLFHVAGEKITNFTAQDGLFEDTILSIHEDEDENFWMSTYHGIFKVSKKDLLSFELGGLKRISFTAYDAADGMKSSEGVGGVQPSSWKTREGKLIFLTAKGITALDPRNVRTNPLPPPVRLEQIVYDGTTNAANEVGNSVSLPPGNGNLEFHYSALSFVAPEKVKFRYQLHGFDQNWIDASTRRIAYYTKVPPGNYRFQVIACNNDGRWNESGAMLSFRISPHFYQTYWFYGGLILIGLMCIYGFHRLRVRRLRSQFSAVLEERNRISREIHDTLTQNFTAVVLQLETAELTLQEEPNTTRDALQRARELARGGLAESRRFVRALRPAPLEQSDLIAALSVVTAQALGGSGVEYKMQVSGKKRVLPQNVEDNLLRITQEAMSNVVKHAQANQVDIEMIYKLLGVELRIRDDGRGVMHDHTGRYEGGFGFISMRERAAQMRGKVEIQSKPNGGTQIVVHIPRW
ncbi:histidine kinase [bacterium]|nr:histidine kinase [bacterium]